MGDKAGFAAAAAGLLLVLAAMELVAPRAAAPGSLLEAPSWLGAPPSFNVKKEDTVADTYLRAEDRRQAGVRAVQALHMRDANFPAISREGNVDTMTGGRARGSYPRRFSAQTSHPARAGERGRAGHRERAAGKAAVVTPEDEWQADQSLRT